MESLPRTESSLLSVKLSTLFLRDLTTQGTIFPVLVSPKTVRDDQGPHGGNFTDYCYSYIIMLLFIPLSAVFHDHLLLNIIVHVAGQSCCCQL